MDGLSVILPTYKYRDSVIISALGIAGRVVRIVVDSEIRYKVRVWDDITGEAKIVTCFDDELEVAGDGVC